MFFKLMLIVLLGSGAVARAGVVDEVSAGRSTSCFRVGTNLYCDGDNTYHQIDASSVLHYSVPIAMGRTVRDRSGNWDFEPYRVETVSVGGDHVCAVFTDHKAYCWGRNTYGQLGNNSLTDATSPSPVAMPREVTAVLSISSGLTHTCAVVIRNNLKRGMCWGRNNRGQVGSVTGAFAAVPMLHGAPFGAPYESIHAGGEFTCALGGKDPGGESLYGRLYCWGDNRYGQLGAGVAEPDPSTTYLVELPPVPGYGIAKYSRARSVATGLDFMCVIVTGNNEYNEDRPFATGNIYCVGNNRFRSTSYPQYAAAASTPLTSTPLVVTTWFRQPVAPGKNNAAVFVASSASAKHACAVLYTGDVWCWGANGVGQVGINTANVVPPRNTDGSSPGVAFPGVVCQENTGVVGYNTGIPCQRGVAVGGFHTMAITTSKALYTWGSNWWGQLGVGDVTDRWVPTPTGF